MAGRSWLHPGVRVGDAAIEGRGLFSNDPIARGTVVLRLAGKRVNGREMREVIAAGGRYAALQIDDDEHLLMEWDDPASRGNHSCDPNLWLDGSLTIAARREIAPGEELTTDYATMTDDPGWSMSCRCGSPGCRGVIRGDDWRLPALQERYRGHVQPFLERRMP